MKRRASAVLRVLRGTSLPVRLGLAALVCAGLALILAGLSEEGALPGDGLSGDGRVPALADAVPYDGRSPRAPAGEAQRVLVQLPRPALGARAGRLRPAAQRAYVRSLVKEGEALRGGLTAQGVRLDDVVTFERTFNGFAATIRTRDIARLGALGLRAAPVRRFFPAVGEPAGPLPDPPARPGAPIAVLAGGVDNASGYDVVGRDNAPAPEPDPRDPGRTEVSGRLLASVLGGELRAIRITAIRLSEGAGAEEYATTDELLTGLERVVDPDLDGATDDHLRVALVGVSAPYAGFAGAPEAQAVRGAVRLGTVVVAPAGHEGAASGALGTIGSPGGARAALTAGALGALAPRVDVVISGERFDDAALLAGTRLPDDLPAGAAAVVRPDPTPLQAVAKAVAAGAKVVVLAQPEEGRPLTGLPAGAVTVPVAGLTGTAARDALERAGANVRVSQAGPVRPVPDVVAPQSRRIAPASSRGPTLDGLVKPDAVRAGAHGPVAGTGVAAALLAADVAALLGKNPKLTPAQVRRRLLGSSAPPAPDVGRPPRLPLGKPVLEREKGRVTGVRFTVGAFERGEPLTARGTAIQPAARLELTLHTAGGEQVRRLTPPGGARELMPGEYAYTLPASELSALAAGSYVFRIAARAPGQTRPTRRVSARFRR